MRPACGVRRGGSIPRLPRRCEGRDKDARAHRVDRQRTAGTIVCLHAGHRALEERDATTGDLRKRNFWSLEGLDTLLRVDDFTINTGLRAGQPVNFFFTTDRMGSPTAALIADEADDAVVVER
ncbi:MAG: hypothetical protein JW741_19470 [Sedimentisphaerales bacterium]|nr:hypothetical protein [Sedimentisphaerales bacterium]